MMNQKKLALRMDDPGASSKEFELYAKNYAKIGRFNFPVPEKLSNFLFFKKCPIWSGWAPYPELNASQWEEVLKCLERNNAKLTVAVTACWVERNGSLTSYPNKFPEAANVLKTGVRSNLVEIACHGLTHCVVGKHLPRLFSSNRRFHREFWDWIPEEIQYNHIKQAQKILSDFFEVPIDVLIPPGNVFCDATVRSAEKLGFKLLNCQTDAISKSDLVIIKNERVVAFHDRDIVKNGISWLDQKISNYNQFEFCFVSELVPGKNNIQKRVVR